MKTDSPVPSVLIENTPANETPVPLLGRITWVQGEDGMVSSIFRVWTNEDAARCRLCPRRDCTFTPGSMGIGTCVQIVNGAVRAELSTTFRLAPVLRAFPLDLP